VKNISLISILLMVISPLSFSDNAQGKITSIMVGHKIWFTISSLPANKYLDTKCNTSSRYVVNATTDKGKAILSTLLMSKSSNFEVHVVGSGLCNIYIDSESVDSIEVL